MKEILFYIPNFSTGGAERVASVLLEYWGKTGQLKVKVVNAAPPETDFYNINGHFERVFLDYDYSEKSLLGSLVENYRRLKKLRRVLKEYQGDTIVSFMVGPSLLLLSAALGTRKKIICCEHSNYYNLTSLFQRTLRLVLYATRANLVTVLTDRDIESFPFYLRKKLCVLANPLGTSDKNRSIGRTPRREVEKEKVTLLFVGSLKHEKGIDRLCEVINKIDHPNWILHVCGDGPHREILQTFVNQKGYQNNVFLHGKILDIEDFYMTSDILMVTSRSEGLPMVIAEAMSFYLPVIAFDCPTGPREFLTNNRNGILVADGDIETYGRELNALMSNPKEGRRLGEAAKKESEKYHVENIAGAWDEILTSV